MFLQLGSIPTLVVSSADVVKNIVKTKDTVFSDRPYGLYAAQKFSYNGNGISFSPYGHAWREVRKIAISELLTFKKTQSFQSVREQEVQLVLDTIAQSPGPVNLSNLMLLLINNIICRVTFGKKYNSGGNGGGRSDSNGKFDDVMHETQVLLGQFVISDYCPWLRWVNKLSGFGERVERNFRQLDKLYDEVIRDHLDPERAKTEQEDFVDVLLRIRKERTNGGFGLSDQQMKGILTDMFIAGTDTSAVTLVWAMAELMRNPAAMKRAQDQVRNHGNGKPKIEESDLPNLVYLKAVVKETFRLIPPVPLLVPRQTTEECMISGYTVPAKTRVFINAKSIGRDPNCWENPEKFEPERFLGSSSSSQAQQQFDLIPFGVGRRRCPGENFAMVIIELALANLLYQFDWKLPDGMSIDKLDMEEVFGLTVFKKTPLFLEARDRKSVV